MRPSPNQEIEALTWLPGDHPGSPRHQGRCGEEELQADLDAWLIEYNERRSHQGRWCFGKTPMQTFLDALPLAKEKLMAA
jgi:hypothetical protein